MDRYFEGILVDVVKRGTLGIMTDDYIVHEFADNDSFEVMGEDGAWKKVHILLSPLEGWETVSDGSESWVNVHSGMLARYKAWTLDEEALERIPDGVDDELPEFLLDWA